MPSSFQSITRTESVRQAQKHYYGASEPLSDATAPDELMSEEIDFIRSRDSFYMASVTENGWPYIQHRGGPVGFLHVMDNQTLAFADFRGNRQMLSTGNLAANDRVALFLMDYPQRTRLKILGHAKVEDASQHQDLVKQLAEPNSSRIVERIFLVKVVGFDWNCPAHITPRYTAAEVEQAVAPLRERIAELEALINKKK